MTLAGKSLHLISLREELLQSIAIIIADYRYNEILQLDSQHVDRWIRQFETFGFDNDAQIVILQEMERILRNYYISSKKAQEFLTEQLTSTTLFGNNIAEGIRNTKFLQIQTKGNSQNDLLELSDKIIQNKYKIRLSDCGDSPKRYIYLDDCLFSGNTVRYNLESWLPNAKNGTTLDLIFFAYHTSGLNYLNKVIIPKANIKDITIRLFFIHAFHNNTWQPSKFACFWPHKQSGDDYINRYVEEVNNIRETANRTLPPLFRPNGMPVEEKIFSSPDSRKIIETAFLKAGSYIVSLPEKPNSSMRPMGYDYFQTLGFGALFVTYRNIANNCPLALWWGDTNQGYPLNQWYPLFPRIVNNT